MVRRREHRLGLGPARDRRADPPQLDALPRPPREHPPALVPRGRDRRGDGRAGPSLVVIDGCDLRHGLRPPPIEQGLPDLAPRPRGGGGCLGPPPPRAPARPLPPPPTPPPPPGGP